MTNESFLLSRISDFSGNYNEMEIPMSIEAYSMAMHAWKRGALVQDAFASLSPEIREFIMSGITPQEWEEMFGASEEEEGV